MGVKAFFLSLFCWWPAAWYAIGLSPVLPITSRSSSRSFEHELEEVSNQLGYKPTNFVGVSARTLQGDPIALETYPLEGGSKRRQEKVERGKEDRDSPLGTPFPTLFWLCNPAISNAISELERDGYVWRIQEEMSREEHEQLKQAHLEYAKLRWSRISASDKELLSSDSVSVARMRDSLEKSGISGTSITAFSENIDDPVGPSIKCLHAHYAHFRSVASPGLSFEDMAVRNPVGLRVHDLLSSRFPTLHLFRSFYTILELKKDGNKSRLSAGNHTSHISMNPMVEERPKQTQLVTTMGEGRVLTVLEEWDKKSGRKIIRKIRQKNEERYREVNARWEEQSKSDPEFNKRMEKISKELSEGCKKMREQVRKELLENREKNRKHPEYSFYTLHVLKEWLY